MTAIFVCLCLFALRILVACEISKFSVETSLAPKSCVAICVWISYPQYTKSSPNLYKLFLFLIFLCFCLIVIRLIIITKLKMSCTLLFLITLRFMFVHVVSKTCDDAYSCFGQDVSTTNSHLYCNGYQSCAYATTVSLNDVTFNIYCNGAYSCYNATEIHNWGGNAYNNDIYCNGLYSCAFVNDIMTASGSVLCCGELSCFGSTIDITDEDDNQYVMCSGDRSCANTLIYVRKYIYLRGNLAAENAVFETSESGATFYFYGGNYAGENTTILCGNGHTCNIVCYGNACNNLNLVCKSSCTFRYVINIYICAYLLCALPNLQYI